MLDMELLLGLYCCGWIAVSLGLFFAGRRLSQCDSPAPHPVWISVLGGALWPLVLVGVIELSSVVVYSRVQHKTDPGVGIRV
ncbi:hypothetical protein [Mycobacterium sp. IDR2000157661]|uniref:hypothetical protein n=1 Tax=Mycobacterium sp. IDR2000157661 TaxID=2867005 RepID=UPI001EEEDD3F|nr:hypothetical protein [Mycobacterium sp. IDR2000157661]ULE35022.1 hypothetical protein K3G64_10880 [Mycobacterium sp. IDR2000157661]